MKRILFSTLLLLHFFAKSQTVNPLYKPGSNADMPIWAKFMYDSPVNYKRLDSAYQAYYKQNTFVKNSYTRYYKRMRGAAQGYIKPDGSLFEATQAQLEVNALQQNTTSQTQTNLTRNLNAANTAWSLLGPTEVWNAPNARTFDGPLEHMKRPHSCNVTSFDIAPSNNDILYCGTEMGGVFKTINKGQTWECVSMNTNFVHDILSIAIHPTNPNIVYVGSNDKIFKTTDGGNNWTIVYTLSNLFAEDIAIHPNNPNILLVCSYLGLFRSGDAGQNWSKIHPDSVWDIEINTANSDEMYVIAFDKTSNKYSFLKSIDSGLTFVAKNNDWETSSFPLGCRMAVSPANPNMIYIVHLGENSIPYIYKSIDKGESFTKTISGNSGAFEMDNGQGYYDLSIMVSPTNADHIIVGTTAIFRSIDGAQNFAKIGGYGGPFALHPDLQECKAQGSDAWIATDGGITHSNDFFDKLENASVRSNGLFASQMMSFSQGWNEDITIGGLFHNGDLLMSEYFEKGKGLNIGGAELSTGYVHHGFERRVSASDASWQYGQFSKDFSKGYDNIYKIGDFPSEMGNYSAHLNRPKFLIDPVYFGTYYLAKDNVLKVSENAGRDYSKLHNFDGKILEIAQSRANPNTLFVLAENTMEKVVGVTLWKTIDKKTWQKVNLNFPSENYSLGNYTSFTLNPTNENEFWLAWFSTNNFYMLHTINGGQSFIDQKIPEFESFEILDVAYQMGTDGLIYISLQNQNTNENKLIYRNNSMANWQSYTEGLPRGFKAGRILPFYRDSKLRAAGNQGIWEAPLPQKSNPLAQPSVERKLFAAGDTIQFEDYSVLEHQGATWLWEFSGANFISNINARNPQVVYNQPGFYDVKLTIKNSTGLENNKTITQMVQVTGQSIIDTVAGKATSIKLNASNQGTLFEPTVQPTKSFSMAYWIKMNNNNDYMGFLGSFEQSKYSKFFLLSYPSTNRVVLTLNGDIYEQYFTDFYIQLDKWQHIALTVDNGKARVYLDGVPSIEYPLFLDSLYFNKSKDISLNFNGNIDEFCLYDKALSTEEVRAMMHLTKNNPNHPEQFDPSLKMYYQFNEENADWSFDKITKKMAFLSGSIKEKSTAPVGGGISEMKTIRTTNTFNFNNTGISLKNAAMPVPDGDIYTYRLNALPDTIPVLKNKVVSQGYWIIRNFGLNKQFAPLEELSFFKINVQNINASSYKLWKRGSNEDLNSWGNYLDLADEVTTGTNGIIKYKQDLNIVDFSQFLITNESLTCPNPVCIDISTKIIKQ